MSLHAVENFFYKIGIEPSEAEKFKADKTAYLSSFKLDTQEQEIIEALDYWRLYDMGVSPMLLLGSVRALLGDAGIPEYMRQINTPPSV